MRVLLPFLAALVVAFVLLVPGTARAQVVLAGDVNVSVAATPKLINTGAGGAIRLGYRVKIPLVALTPEVGGAYHHFGSSPAGEGIARGFGGARLAIGEIVKPSVFAHAGYGASVGTGGSAAFTYDVGAALDFTALPVLDFGIHGSYASLATGGAAIGWVDLGAQVAIVF
ncbi:MAG: hypothetical protein U0169_17180 [Polyangiaceae bacterium]